jgi:hypothetical protein
VINEHWLPTRLLYLGTLDALVVRVVSTSPLLCRVPYAALSCRWGNTRIYVLTSALLPKYEKEIPLSDLSVTTRDAFHATRSTVSGYIISGQTVCVLCEMAWMIGLGSQLLCPRVSS